MLDEYEALRLCDALGLDQAVAAQAMGVSRPTLGRILERGRRKIARVLVEGQALLIQGGPVEVRGRNGGYGLGRQHCAGRTGRRQGRGSRGAGPAGALERICLCAGCGYREVHQYGVPCAQRLCPQCGVALTRQKAE